MRPGAGDRQEHAGRTSGRTAGIRTRTTATVAIAALAVSTLMAVLTFQLTRAYLTDQRDRLATRQASLNARLLQDVLPSGDAEAAASALTSLSLDGGSQALLNTDGRWLGSSIGLSEASLPADVLEGTTGGTFTRRRANIDGVPHVIVGIPLLEGRAGYFEFFPLRELQRTLRTMSISLTASAAITTVAGAAFGASLSQRVLRPLAATSAVARRIAAGETELRLPGTADRQLAPLYESFNDMVDALAQRVERERRFAADVSHELRTPLTALLSAASILDRQHASLPTRAQLATEIMSNQLAHFRDLVLDLLDMSRMESGADVAQLDWIDLERLIERQLEGRDPKPMLVTTGLHGPVATDGRRVDRVLTNLLDNAERYAGGAVRVSLHRCAEQLTLTVDDAGPGVAPSERQAIFERLHRGDAARASGRSGNGLGLALAAEHVRLLGGTIDVEESPEAGARFVVRLPTPADRTAP